MKYRIERDPLGSVRVPATAYYGAQTQRAVENFQISGITSPFALVLATVQIKKAAAEANSALGRLDTSLARAIVQAADEVLEGLFPWEKKYAVTGVPASIQAFDPERQTLLVRIPWSNRAVNGVRFFAPGQPVSHAQWKRRYGDPSGMVLSVRFQCTPAEARSYRESAEPTTAEITYQLERFEVATNPLPSYALLCRALRTVGVVPAGVRIRQGETVLYEDSFGSEVASGD